MATWAASQLRRALGEAALVASAVETGATAAVVAKGVADGGASGAGAGVVLNKVVPERFGGTPGSHDVDDCVPETLEGEDEARGEVERHGNEAGVDDGVDTVSG